MKRGLLTLMSALAGVTGCTAQTEKPELPKSFYSIEAKAIDGTSVKMEQYKGKVLLIVNTASKCGFTGQYAGLESLYKKYAEKGFLILGFPSNDFLKQEPGTNEEIAQFCTANYGVTFPMFEKIVVKGDGQHPLYVFLTDKQTDPKFGGEITWNFNKFLIDRNGTIINRFGSRTAPEDKELIEAVEQALTP